MKKIIAKKATAMVNRAIKSGYTKFMVDKFGEDIFTYVADNVRTERQLAKFKTDMQRVRSQKIAKRDSARYEKKLHDKKVEQLENVVDEKYNELKDLMGAESVYEVEKRKKSILFEESFDKLTTKELNEKIRYLKSDEEIEKIVEFTDKEKNDFIDKYFTELRTDGDYQAKKQQILDNFEGSYSDFIDFMQYVTNPSWTGEYDSDQGKKNWRSYHDEMRGRLDKMIVDSKASAWK